MAEPKWGGIAVLVLALAGLAWFTWVARNIEGIDTVQGPRWKDRHRILKAAVKRGATKLPDTDLKYYKPSFDNSK